MARRGFPLGDLTVMPQIRRRAQHCDSAAKVIGSDERTMDCLEGRAAARAVGVRRHRGRSGLEQIGSSGVL
jgi:hypothetical protein